MTEAYPLAWPEGWPRASRADRKDGDAVFRKPPSGSGPTYKSSRPWTFAEARDALLEEAWRHCPTSVTLSTNFQPGRNGPQEGRRRPDDEGVAIYFQRHGKPYVMACDRYHEAEGNMRSLALALEALRQLERHGGGTMMEKAFAGFAALPPPTPWWEVLGCPSKPTAAEIEAAYRAKARAAHPDAGGSDAQMAEINAARDHARRSIQGRDQ